jgi:hypothetical protein
VALLGGHHRALLAPSPAVGRALDDGPGVLSVLSVRS